MIFAIQRIHGRNKFTVTKDSPTHDILNSHEFKEGRSMFVASERKKSMQEIEELPPLENTIKTNDH